MPEKVFNIIQEYLMDRLKNLDPDLTYHNKNHTLDVVRQAERIAASENIHDERTVFLLKLAALYHDCGFLNSYDGHEELSCEIFLKDSEGIPISEKEKELVLQLIMVTKNSIDPETHLEKILCDADLDYLGRDDFPQISEKLKNELLSFKKIKDTEEWEKRQLDFLKMHKYYTKSSQQLREPVKQKNYKKLL